MVFAGVSPCLRGFFPICTCTMWPEYTTRGYSSMACSPGTHKKWTNPCAGECLGSNQCMHQVVNGHLHLISSSKVENKLSSEGDFSGSMTVVVWKSKGMHV
jgi:hypothetical protein